MPGIDLQNAQSSQLKLQGWRILDTFENEDTALTYLTYTVHYPLKAPILFHLIYRAIAWLLKSGTMWGRGIMSVETPTHPNLTGRHYFVKLLKGLRCFHLNRYSRPDQTLKAQFSMPLQHSPTQYLPESENPCSHSTSDLNTCTKYWIATSPALYCPNFHSNQHGNTPGFACGLSNFFLLNIIYNSELFYLFLSFTHITVTKSLVLTPCFGQTKSDLSLTLHFNTCSVSSTSPQILWLTVTNL